MPSGPGSLDAQGVWQYGEADDVAPASDLLNVGQSSVSAQFAVDRARMLALEKRSYKWANAAARTAQTGMTEGDIGDQADTNQRWRYSGSAWVNITVGLIPVVPTSVAAGSGTAVIGVGGVVTATAVGTSLSIEGLTTAFDNYLLVVNLTHSVVAGLTARLRSGGADLSGANYNSILTHSTASTTTTSSASGATSFGVQSIGGFASNGEMMLYSPMVAAASRFKIDMGVMLSGTTEGLGKYSGTYTPSTLCTGITFIPSSGTITGTIRIYGYNNLS